MSRAVIAVRGAAFQYSDHVIFDALDMEVHSGEVLTILGANGCGKSTLLRCLGGALNVTSGSVRMGDADLARLDPAARARKVGFLFQQHSPTFPFSVLDIVVLGRTPHLSSFGAPSSEDEALALRTLAQFGLLHLRERPYTELSGGERQLVLLCRALVQEPEVILLDEPTAHLDLKNQVACLKVIGALAARGIAVAMTSHDPNHAFLFPGRVVLMQQGRSIVIGASADIINHAALTATYGLEVGVFSIPRAAPAGDLKFCSPW